MLKSSNLVEYSGKKNENNLIFTYTKHLNIKTDILIEYSKKVYFVQIPADKAVNNGITNTKYDLNTVILKKKNNCQDTKLLRYKLKLSATKYN